MSKKKDLYNEGGAIDKTAVSAQLNQLTDLVRQRIETGQSHEEVLYFFLQEGVPQQELALAFEGVGYTPEDFGNLMQNLEKMIQQAEQQKQIQAQQEAQMQAQQMQQIPQYGMNNQEQMQQLQQFTGQPSMAQGGNVLPKAQRGRGNWPDNRFMTLVDPKGRKSKSPRDPSLRIGAQTLAPVMRKTDDDIRTGRGFTVNPALHTYVFDRDRNSELRGTLRNEIFWYQSPIEKDAYNQDILQGGLGAMADIDYTTLPQKRNMRNMAIDLGLDAGLGVGTMEVGPMYEYDKDNAGEALPYAYLTGKAGLRDRRRGLQGNVFAGYGTPRSPKAGFRIGAEGSIPLITNKRGLKITANPSASYDFTSGAPRFGLNLGLNLPSRRQQGGSLPKAQDGTGLFSSGEWVRRFNERSMEEEIKRRAESKRRTQISLSPEQTADLTAEFLDPRNYVDLVRNSPYAIEMPSDNTGVYMPILPPEVIAQGRDSDQPQYSTNVMDGRPYPAPAQEYVETYYEPNAGRVLLNRLANPMTTAGYIARGQDIPNRVPDKGNPIDMAFEINNPFAWMDYGMMSSEALGRGDYLGAGLNALGIVPGPFIGQQYVKQALQSAPVQTFKNKARDAAIQKIINRKANKGAKLTKEEKNTFRTIEALGRMYKLNKPEKEAYLLAVENNLPDEYYEKIFNKTKKELDAIHGSGSAPVEIIPSGAVDEPVRTTRRDPLETDAYDPVEADGLDISEMLAPTAEQEVQAGINAARSQIRNDLRRLYNPTPRNTLSRMEREGILYNLNENVADYLQGHLSDATPIQAEQIQNLLDLIGNGNLSVDSDIFAETVDATITSAGLRQKVKDFAKKLKTKAEQRVKSAVNQVRKKVGSLENIERTAAERLSPVEYFDPNALDNASDFYQTNPTFFLDPTMSLRDQMQNARKNFGKDVPSGDVFTGSLSTSHNSYPIQTKLAFEGDLGNPVFLGYKPMNPMGFLSSAGVDNSNIVRFLNSQFDDLVKRQKLPSNVYRPYLNPSGGKYNSIMVPQYGVRMKQDGGEENKFDLLDPLTIPSQAMVGLSGAYNFFNDMFTDPGGDLEDRRRMTRADDLYQPVENQLGKQGNTTINEGFLQPNQRVPVLGNFAKKGGEFKPHMMYDPNTGKGFKAQKYEDHLRMDKMGYTHDKPARQGGELEVDNDTLAALIAAGADIQML